MDTVKEGKAGEEDEDDVPELVGTNFEEASKQQWVAHIYWVSQMVDSQDWSKANHLIPLKIFEYIFMISNMHILNSLFPLWWLLMNLK